MDIKLEFHKAIAEAPAAICNHCNQKKQVKFVARLYPFVDEDCTFDVLACSENCRDAILNLPEEQKVLGLVGLVMIACFELNWPLKDEWAGYLDKYTDKINTIDNGNKT